MENASDERRAAAYTEFMTALRRLEMGIERKAPFWGPLPDARPSLSDEQAWHLSALADAPLPRKVGDMIEAWLRTLSQFDEEVRDF